VKLWSKRRKAEPDNAGMGRPKREGIQATPSPGAWYSSERIPAQNSSLWSRTNGSTERGNPSSVLSGKVGEGDWAASLDGVGWPKKRRSRVMPGIRWRRAGTREGTGAGRGQSLMVHAEKRSEDRTICPTLSAQVPRSGGE
jgi:hypothetical protein